ncbi:MAG: hypothetical protein M1431_07550 [Candidatus Thermoplasmatota archaeon]|nr:hypothetical protein [Candidatus Thermoplasmatota archaeon]
MKKKYEIYSTYILTTEIANIVRNVLALTSKWRYYEISKGSKYNNVYSSIIKGIDKYIVLGKDPCGNGVT